MEAVGLQTHIWNNNLRSAFLLAGFPVLLLGMVYFIVLGMIGAGYLPAQGDAVAASFGYMLAAAPLAIGVSLVWFAIAYFANTSIIDALTGARPVTRNEEPELYNLLENLCISRGLPMPGLHIIETDALNAFASGVTQKQYAVTVTRGLMQTLNKDELEAVLGHELTHILSRDVRTMVIASVFAGIITLLAQVIFRAIMWGGVGRSSSREDRKGGNFIFVIIALAVAAVGYVLAIVIRMALSRQREFVADAGAVALTKNPDAMISALQKISGRSHLEAPDSVRGMFIENGGDRSMSAMGLFDTHPPIEKRIAALVQYAGGVVREPAYNDRAFEPAPTYEAAPFEPEQSSDETDGPWGDRRPRGPWG
ncbi:MAG: M48 family metallopeptidase [Caulobacterales bacterium]|nr:M48 family metallopeptidase [Caulobacterales bacterium]